MENTVMMSDTASPKKVRIPEIDYIKAICILAMILVHCYEEFYEGEGTTSSSLFVDVFNVLIGASSFMFCMGFTMDIKKERSPLFCFQRGALLFFTGILLNIVRGPLFMCLRFLSEDPDTVFICMIDVLSADILPFAGLSFLLMGALKALKLKPAGIFLLSLAFCAAATFFRYTDMGSPVLNALSGFFIGSKAESYFPLFHWFPFVAAGNLFRSLYVKIEDKKAYYRKALPVTAAISAVFIILGIFEVGPFQCLSEEMYYCWMNPVDVLGCTACVLTYMGLMWLLSLLADKLQPKFRPLSYLSENLSALYIIHWLFLMFVEYVLIDTFELLTWLETDAAVYLYALIFLALTILICELLKKLKRKSRSDMSSGAAIVLACVTVVLAAVCVALAVSHGLDEIPSFLNGFSIDGVPVM